MSIGWSTLTFTPSGETVARLAESWGWLIREPFAPRLFSILGDMFFEPDSGGIWWLNTGTAEVTRVADTLDEFRERLGTEAADEWFLPALVEALHAAGKVPEAGECYSYVTLPIFAEGKYEVDNLNPVPADEHFALTGHLLQEILTTQARDAVPEEPRK